MLANLPFIISPESFPAATKINMTVSNLRHYWTGFSAGHFHLCLRVVVIS
jgi:hypothetical protein